MRLSGVVSRHRGPFLAAVVVAGIAAVTFFTIRTGTGKAKTAKTAPTATTTAPAGPVAELVRLVERGKSSDVDAAYTGSAGAASGAFGVHLWRRGPLARIDTQVGAGDAARRSAQLVTPSGPFACTQAGSAPWSCAPKAGLGIADVGVVSPELVSRLFTLAVSVRDERIVDQAVRCFTVAAPPTTVPTTGAADLSTAEVCLTSDGIAMRVDAGPTHLEAVSVDRGRPPDSVFKLPTSP